MKLTREEQIEYFQAGLLFALIAIIAAASFYAGCYEPQDALEDASKPDTVKVRDVRIFIEDNRIKEVFVLIGDVEIEYSARTGY